MRGTVDKPVAKAMTCRELSMTLATSAVVLPVVKVTRIGGLNFFFKFQALWKPEMDPVETIRGTVRMRFVLTG